MPGRHVPTWETTTPLYTAYTKDGAAITLRLGLDIEPPNRGFISHEISAWENQDRVGYLRIGFVPKSRIKTYLPTPWHHCSSFGGWCHRSPLFKDFHGEANHPKDFSAQNWSVFKEEVAQRFYLSDHDWPTYTAMMRNLKGYRKLIQIQADFRKFKSFHLDRPLVDYIQTGHNPHNGVNTCNQGRGIGLCLYAAGAHWLATQNLLLHASGLQSESAQRMWSFFKSQRWTMKKGTRLVINPSAIPTPAHILHSLTPSCALDAA